MHNELMVAEATVVDANPASRNLLRILLHRKMWVIVPVVLFSALAFLYWHFKAPVYKVAAELGVNQNAQRLASGALGTRVSARRWLYTQRSIVESALILRPALKSPSLRDTAMFRGVRYKLGRLERRLRVDVGRHIDVMDIYLHTTHPESGIDVVNAVVHSYVAWQNRRLRSSGEALQKAFTKARDALRRKVAKGMVALSQYKKVNGVVSFQATRNNTVIASLRRLSTAMTAAQLDLVQQQTVYNAAKVFKNNPRGMRAFAEMQQTASTPYTATDEQFALRKSLHDLLAQAANQHKKYGRDYQVVAPIEASIREVRRQLKNFNKRFGTNFLAVLHAESDAARAKYQAIRADYKQQKQAAILMNAKAAKYQGMREALARNQKLLGALESRLSTFQLASHVLGSRVTRLFSASIAGRPKPHLSKVLALGSMVGVALGVMLALLREWTDARLFSADEAARSLGMPLLGAVPHIGGFNLRKRAKIVLLRQHSDVAEAFRSVRVSLLGGYRNAVPQTILVTSATAGEGKSVCAANLAIAIANSRRRTILVDGDMRNPVQDRVFDVADSPGLSEILEGGASLEQAVVATEVPGLDLLPAGGMPDNPMELLAGDRFRQLMHTLRTRYDSILLDSPPIAPVSDARLLAECTDGVVMVVRLRQATWQTTQYASSLLRGNKLCGTVVNDVSRDAAGPGYYGKYKQRRQTRTITEAPSVEQIGSEASSAPAPGNPAPPMGAPIYQRPPVAAAAVATVARPSMALNDLGGAVQSAVADRPPESSAAPVPSRIRRGLTRALALMD